MNNYITKWVNKIPNIEGHEVWLTTLIMSIGILLLAFIVYFIAKRIVVHLIHRIFTKTESNLDDILVQRKVFGRIAYLVPSWVLYKLMPEALANFPALASMTTIAIQVYFVIVIMLIADSIISLSLIHI